MADLSDVLAALAAIATAACYPNSTPSPSVTGIPITIGQGWPKPADLDAMIALSPPQSMVTVFAVPGATSVSAQIFEDPYILVPAVHGMSLTNVAGVVTITGNPNPGEYLTFVLNQQKVYSQIAVGGDTASTMATALAGLIHADFPATTASGPVVTLDPSISTAAARVGAPATMAQLIHRQKQQIRVIVWSPNPTDRSAISAPVDVAMKQNLRLTFSDLTQAKMTYQTVYIDDNSQNNGLYRRDNVYAVEYGTVDTFTAYEITSFTIELSNALNIAPTANVIF